MSASTSQTDLTAAKKEVSESSLEYLIGEILNFEHPNPDENSENAVSLRLEKIGYDIGYRLVAKLSNGHKFIGTEPLDLVKFICKEFWEDIFRKKVDKLQTNHKGVFVLTDSKFRWLEKYSSSDDIASKQAASKMLHIPCGIICGALANLGLPAIVNADFNNLPACTFNIRIKL